MSYSTYNSQDLEQTVNRLQQRVASLADEVDEQRDRHRSLDVDVEIVGDRVTTLESTVDETQEAQQQLADDLREEMEAVASAVRDLAATVGWVERRLRAEKTIAPAQLDTVDATVRELAERSRQGQQSAAVLLDQPARAVHKRRIDELARLEEQIEQTTTAALAHSATLAATEPSSEAHVQAATAYRTFARALGGYRTQLPAARTAAIDARRALHLDDRHREVHGPQVMTGESARAQLRARMRTRLDAAVAEGALLPAWLILALGHQPVGEDVAQWMDTATSLLAYRVTYEVIDPVVALGPGAYDDPQRETWREELERRLKARRHWPI